MSAQLPPPGDERALYVLDLSGYVFRAYHALPPLSNSHGEATHATLGVANMLNRLVREQRPVFLAVAMDSKSDQSRRREIYPEYKATRPPTPPDLGEQMVRCRELVEAYAIPVLHAEGYEADDLIAACVREARRHSLNTVICSADKDLMQLVAPDVVMWDAMRNRVFGSDEVREKWGVSPEQVRDLLALMGDTSDNVPGVTGIGEKTAAKLVKEFGSLDGVYRHVGEMKGKLRDNLVRDEPNARLSFKLVSLEDDVPVRLELDALRYGGWDASKLRALFHQLEFQKLADAVEPAPTIVANASPAITEPAKSETAVDPTATAAGYLTVRTRAELDHVVAECRTAREIAVHANTTSLDAWRATLVGVSLAWAPGRAAYVPFGHRVLGDAPQLERAEAIAALGPLLADASVAKIAHDIKYDDQVLRSAGAPVSGYVFDTMLASYLIDPERHAHRLDEIASVELGVTMASAESAARKTRTRAVAADEVDTTKATRTAAEIAHVARRVAHKLRPRIDEDAPLAALFRDVELPLALVLSGMEAHGVLVDVARLRAQSVELGVEIERLEKELHVLAGREFNVNSPRQLETILFDELKLPVHKRTKTSRSTDHEVLDELAEEHPIAAKILEHRQLAKLQGTYLDALPALVNPATGRIHTSYAQAVAATGRLSSNNPNLQNIPIRSAAGGRIREAFVAPPGYRILSADYSQIELRVLAHLSGDPILLDAFRKNEDIHVRTAMEIHHVPENQVTRPMRAQAKTTNFAVLYGQGESALARNLGIPRADAAKFIEKYFATFPGLTRFLDATIERARAGEGVRTLLGRRRFLPAISSENRGLRAQAERIAKNTPIQGSAADIMKVAMVRIAKQLADARMDTKMILTVHDELVFEVPEREHDAAESLVRRTMEGAMQLDVPLLVQVGWGANWGEAH